MFQYNRNLLHLEPESITPPTPVTNGIYWSQSLWLISILYNWTTVTFADKNIWATTVWNDWDNTTSSNCWKFFQWGNNYGFPYDESFNTTTDEVDVSSYSWSNPYSWNTFVYNHLWRMLNSNYDLWWDSTDTLIARQWPCASWFHIPTRREMMDVNTMYYNIDPDNPRYSPQEFIKLFKLPPAWFLQYQDGTHYHPGYGPCQYRYSTVDINAWNKAYAMVVGTIGGWSVTGNSIGMAVGACIRPMKNTPVTPDSSWTLIWNGY